MFDSILHSQNEKHNYLIIKDKFIKNTFNNNKSVIENYLFMDENRDPNKKKVEELNEINPEFKNNLNRETIVDYINIEKLSLNDNNIKNYIKLLMYVNKIGPENVETDTLINKNKDVVEFIKEIGVDNLINRLF